MIKAQIYSSQTKIFPDTRINIKKSIKYIRTLKNEPVSFQLAFISYGDDDYLPISVSVKSELPISAYKVAYVPVTHTQTKFDEPACEARGPGLYPDMLVPRPASPEIISNSCKMKFYCEKGVNEPLVSVKNCTNAVWFTVNEEGKELAAGKYTIDITVTDLLTDKIAFSKELTLEVLDLSLDESELIYTNWLYVDCIARYYNLKPYSKRFWDIFSRMVKNAAIHKMNTLLLPAFTPPLDTPVGTERMNVQLVSVERTENGYAFDFSLFEKYVQTAIGCGIKYFEHIPMYTQWGAEHAPNIYAKINGRSVRIFGWETDAHGEEYKGFLREYINALKPVLEKLDISERIIYHLSDEPGEAALEAYGKAADYFYSLIGESTCIDAMSEIKLYKMGLVHTPVVALDRADDFYKEKADMMLYYTGGYYDGGYLNKCSNRLLTTKPYRTRILGTQLYRYAAKGFLHWGYNYYFDRMSIGMYDPKTNPCGYKQVPGAAYLAYPANNGDTYPSVREKSMAEAICDNSALMLLEKKRGRKYVEELCDKFFGERVSVTTMPKSEDEMLAFKELIYDELLK
ncbi:MAG: DUF4091 domain-containing protein [Clostridia bacterium]|nr:DUF4091 domain-containing protein [Clostridia bacterium]